MVVSLLNVSFLEFICYFLHSSISFPLKTGKGHDCWALHSGWLWLCFRLIWKHLVEWGKAMCACPTSDVRTSIVECTGPTVEVTLLTCTLPPVAAELLLLTPFPRKSFILPPSKAVWKLIFIKSFELITHFLELTKKTQSKVSFGNFFLQICLIMTGFYNWWISTATDKERKKYNGEKKNVVEVRHARAARRVQEIGQATPFNASRNPLHHLGVGDTHDQDF